MAKMGIKAGSSKVGAATVVGTACLGLEITLNP